MYQVSKFKTVEKITVKDLKFATLAEARRYFYNKFGPECVDFELDPDHAAADCAVFVNGDCIIYSIEPIKE